MSKLKQLFEVSTQGSDWFFRENSAISNVPIGYDISCDSECQGRSMNRSLTFGMLIISSIVTALIVHVGMYKQPTSTPPPPDTHFKCLSCLSWLACCTLPTTTFILISYLILIGTYLLSLSATQPCKLRERERERGRRPPGRAPVSHLCFFFVVDWLGRVERPTDTLGAIWDVHLKDMANAACGCFSRSLTQEVTSEVSCKVGPHWPTRGLHYWSVQIGKK